MQQIHHYHEHRNKHLVAVIFTLLLTLMAISEFVPYLYGFQTLHSWTYGLLFGQWAPIAYLFSLFALLRHLFHNKAHHLPPFLHMHYINYALILIILCITLTAFVFNFNNITNQGFNNSFNYWWDQIRVSQWYSINVADGGLISALLYGGLTELMPVAYLLPMLAVFALLATFLFTVGSWVGFWHFISSPFHKQHRLKDPVQNYTSYKDHTKKLRNIESGHHRYLKSRNGSPVTNRRLAVNETFQTTLHQQNKFSKIAKVSNSQELFDQETLLAAAGVSTTVPTAVETVQESRQEINLNEVNLSPIMGDINKTTPQKMKEFYHRPGAYPEMDQSAKAEAKAQADKYASDLLNNHHFDAEGNLDDQEIVAKTTINPEPEFNYSFAPNNNTTSETDEYQNNDQELSDEELFSFGEESSSESAPLNENHQSYDGDDDDRNRFLNQDEDDQEEEEENYSYQNNHESEDDFDDYEHNIDDDEADQDEEEYESYGQQYEEDDDDEDDVQAALRNDDYEDGDYSRSIKSNSKISSNHIDEEDNYKKYNTSNLLHPESNRLNYNQQVKWAENKIETLDDVFSSFHIDAKTQSYIIGPTVTKFMIIPGAGVNLKKITNLANNFKLSLAVHSLRIEAPTPGTSLVGIEVPNINRQTVSIKEIVTNLSTDDELNPLAVGLGKDINGNIVVLDIEKAPHLLIAGATGSGKSVCINGIINTILMKATPQQVKFILIDPKKVELINYEAIPHLLTPIISDPEAANYALDQLVNEMENRYSMMADHKIRNIDAYNEYAINNDLATWPKIVVIIDELADLMSLSSKTVEKSIIRITQKARAAGIHLIVATQRPSTNVITGLIKANLPSRIAFAVSAQVDSRTIIDFNGAETLIGNGDMLFSNFGHELIRLQGGFIADQEIDSVIRFASTQGKPNFNPKYQKANFEID